MIDRWFGHRQADGHHDHQDGHDLLEKQHGEEWTTTTSSYEETIWVESKQSKTKQKLKMKINK